MTRSPSARALPRRIVFETDDQLADGLDHLVACVGDHHFTRSDLLRLFCREGLERHARRSGDLTPLKICNPLHGRTRVGAPPEA